MTQTYSKEDDDILIRMHFEGRSDVDIGEVIGRSKDSVRHRRVKLGLRCVKDAELTEAQIAAIKTAARRGWSPLKIARKVNYCLDLIYDALEAE